MYFKELQLSMKSNLFRQHYTNTHFSAGAAVVQGTKKETESGTEVVTESGNVIETVTERILLAGRVQECLEDTETVPERVERGTRSAHGSETGTEIATANLVSFPAIIKPHYVQRNSL